MRIINEKPPIYDKILAVGMLPHAGVVYTYGDAIYNPSGAVLPEYLIIHEEVHMTQQGDHPDTWWARYLDDQHFRIEQELEAYAKQYVFICRFVKDRNQRAKILLQLACSLSGPIYGKVVSQQWAYEEIKKKSNVK